MIELPLGIDSFCLFMIYSFSLSSVTIVLGLVYILTHGFALWNPSRTQSLLKVFPRSQTLGSVLMVLAALWFAWILQTADLMEFTVHRTRFLIGLAVLLILILIYVQEFIAVRALGCLLLLGANVLLDSAFPRDDYPRLVITATAYFYIIFGMFWVGAPYLLRDHIKLLTAKPARFKIASALGSAFGALLLILGIFVY